MSKLKRTLAVRVTGSRTCWIHSTLPEKSLSLYATTLIATGESFFTRGMSTSYTSPIAQTWSISPTVKSSTAVPLTYCPATSTPRLIERISTSPSIAEFRV